ncbi:hypothetical protein GQ607_003592 [Colletotrichum asianum]|uniref:Uncharacterized protein n=1 Tax=Colletotrichum asianum TaxID=702518 RepID=A0A8H3WRJ0_9PEZI|nr:hypothetical protein GQ607_003592 [Colletotrichum asianum]
MATWRWLSTTGWHGVRLPGGSGVGSVGGDGVGGGTSNQARPAHDCDGGGEKVGAMGRAAHCIAQERVYLPLSTVCLLVRHTYAHPLPRCYLFPVSHILSVY